MSEDSHNHGDAMLVKSYLIIVNRIRALNEVSFVFPYGNSGALSAILHMVVLKKVSK